MPSAQTTSGVTLRGLPQQLLAVIPMPPSGVGWLRVDLDIPDLDRSTQLMALVAPSGLPAYAELRLSLPGTTLAGRYTGKIWIGEREVPLTVEVQPNPTLRVVPEGFQARAGGGDEVNVEVTLLNPGNVPYDVRSGYAFALVDANALDRAFSRTTGTEVEASTKRAATTGSSGRADRFVDELAEGRGGPVRVEVQQGVGALAPGEARELRARLKLPDRLRPGRTYSGAWRLDDAAFSVRIQVADGGQPQEDFR